MTILAKLQLGFLTLFLILVTTPATSTDRLTCFDHQVHLAATPMTPTQVRRMLTDGSYEDNKLVPKKEKIDRVLTSINDSHHGLPYISDKKLAEKIVDVAQCVGLDFTVFAGLLKKESDYCLNMRNTSSDDSTASGCGQFTVWPIREFKNNLMLPMRTANGFPETAGATRHLLKKCLNRKDYNQFLTVYSMHEKKVKDFLWEAKNINIDLVASAVFLKFHYGRVGFYYDPNTPDPGALSLYGEGANYAGLVDKFSRSIDHQCVDDYEYIKEIEQTSCELSKDPAACFLTTPTFEI